MYSCMLSLEQCPYITLLLLMMYKFMFKFIINILGYPVDTLSYRQVLHITKCIVEMHMQ